MSVVTLAQIEEAIAGLDADKARAAEEIQKRYLDHKADLDDSFRREMEQLNEDYERKVQAVLDGLGRRASA